jgi:molybdopterin-guanine dinucleotide biosynthesis protein A
MPTLLQDAAGFLLAGGQSSRMGADKALVRRHNLPLIEIALQAMRSIGLEPKIAGARSPLHTFAPVIQDIHPGHGPLSGVHAALSASTARWNLFLPVDMPLIPASLLKYLLHRAILTGAPITALTRNGHLEPFPVVLDRVLLPCIEQRIAARQLACRDAWQAIPNELGARLDAPSVEMLRTLGHCSHPGGLAPYLWLQNANTPADLARIQHVT